MLTLEQSEQIQADLITYLDSYPEELIDRLCQVVVDYRKETEGETDVR